MIHVAEALERVMERARPLSAVRVSLDHAHGHALAEDVASSMDSPPHDKTLVDGYAVQAGDLASGSATLRILEEITAGQVPTCAVEPGAATRVMTGAPIPPEADAVVMLERTQTIEGAPPRVAIHEGQVRPGQNIMRRGTSMRRGDTVLKTGHRLRAIEIGLLAEIGSRDVAVTPRPTVAVLATGNELVPWNQSPDAGQIRNSNGPMLSHLVREAGGEPIELGIATDDEQELAKYIRRGLEADVLLLSGGVSAGVLDLVPNVLHQSGVREIFHKVHLRPGKPLWFGTCARQDGPERLVFGLPGNPVSSLVCFLLFVRPALARLAGGAGQSHQQLPARLASKFSRGSDRPTYFPGRTVERDGERFVDPLDWQGSADLRTLVDADALICVPAGVKSLDAGEFVTIQFV